MLTINNPELRKIEQQKLLDNWTHPVGTPVVVTDDAGSTFESVTTSEPTMLGGHTAVIKLEGISSVYALERVKAEPQPEVQHADPAAGSDTTATTTVKTKSLEEPKMAPEPEAETETETVEFKAPRTFEPPKTKKASKAAEIVSQTPLADVGEFQPLRLQQLKVRNIMGIEEYDLQLDGSLTRITGHNAAGKTSLVTSLLSLFGGGSTAEMIHNGAEKGEIIGILSDGTEARKRIGQTRSKSGITVKQEGKPVSSPATFMKQLADFYNLNPLEFVQAKPSQQLDLLLQALPMSISADELMTMTGITDLDCSEHALTVLDAAYKRLYDERTGINGSVKKCQASIARIEQSIPEDLQDRDELEASKAKLISERDQFDQQRQAKHTSIGKETQDGYARVNAERDSIHQEIGQEEEGIRTEIQRLNESLQALATRRAEADHQHSSKTQQINSWAEGQKAAANHEFEKNTQTANSGISEIDIQLQNLSSHENTCKMLEEEQTELASLQSQQSTLNTRLGAIQDRKKGLLNDIPIDGLSVENGELMANGVPFSMVNTAEQLHLAVKIAELRLPTGPDALRLIVIDRAESMDTRTIRELHKATNAADIQLLLVGTDDCELTVTHGEQALCPA